MERGTPDGKVRRAGSGALTPTTIPRHTRVTLLSEELWRSRFAADPDIVGRSTTLDGRPYQVVGVLPRTWTFPDPSDRLWLPLEWDPTRAGPFWGSGGLMAVGRLAPGSSASAAQAELRGFSSAISAANPIWTPPASYRARAEVVPLRNALVADVRGMLWVLLAAVATVLLVVCANVSSLLTARSLERASMLAVRRALGAGRARLVREALVESGLLGLVGGLMWIASARGGLELLRPLLVGGLPRAAELDVDGTALAVSLAVGLSAGLAAGVLPALGAARRDPGDAFRGPRAAAASLLGRTLVAMSDVDPGFDAPHVLTADVVVVVKDGVGFRISRTAGTSR